MKNISCSYFMTIRCWFSFIFALCLIIGGFVQQNKLLMIYGLYPATFSFLILYVTNEGGFGRFNHAYPTIIAVFAIVFEKGVLTVRPARKAV